MTSPNTAPPPVIRPVILCGGAGARLWPASRPDRPKPFLKLFADRSLFQDTVLRVGGLPGARAPIVVCGAGHVSPVSEQLAELGTEALVIVEPEGRDSAPAILAAAAWIAEHDPSAIALVVASDHHLPDIAAFADAVLKAAPAATEGAIVTFGVRPSSPSPAYGYIRPGAPTPGVPGVAYVADFIEKPSPAAAAAHVADGFLWNSGNFLFRPATLLAETERHAPSLLGPVRAALAGAEREGALLRLGPEFARAPRISIDFAVMEKTAAAAVLPVGYAWSDVGSWAAIWDASIRDEADNALSGQAFATGANGCLIRAEAGATVVALGVRDLVIVVEGGKVLIADRSRTPDLKAVLDELGGTGAGPSDRDKSLE
ncbi:mannose-1-phosphate guanylyltransferase [Caulobacter sp. KR2-114]|uniref:mannose-1-phosphate guanylyltransferase n=1 Tax=Caulobacter sp. KR2-114 TaxID=3400912 RepID=UPI003C0085C2